MRFFNLLGRRDKKVLSSTSSDFMATVNSREK